MMNQPLNQLVEKAGGCRYMLVTAVAQRAVLDLFKGVEGRAVLFEQLADLLSHAEAEQVIVNHTAHQELRREIVRVAGVLMLFRADQPAIRDLGHQGAGYRGMELIGRCLRGRGLELTLEVELNSL